MTIASHAAPEETPEQALARLGWALPDLEPPRGNYRPCVLDAGLVYLSGKGYPVRQAADPVPQLGAGVGIDEAREHARQVALYHVAVLRDALGSLSRVRRFVRVFGMVNAAADFRAHPEVVNGYSDAIVAVFGDRGRHARSAIGVGSLPRGFAVEIEATVAFD